MIGFWKHTVSRFKSVYQERGGDWDELQRSLTQAKALFEHHKNILAFGVGFVFDSLTLNRIDAWLDLVIQGLYLGLLSALLLAQHEAGKDRWKFSGRWAKLWKFNEEVLHFLFGGLLSAYVIFYSKSGVTAQTFLFFAFIAGLLVYNEMPQARKWGAPLRIALYTVCLASFLIYFVPVLAGKMGDGVFALSMLATAAGTGGLLALMTRLDKDKKAELTKLALPAVLLLGVLTSFYYLRWIPPVPLSLQFSGIYHKVERKNGEYALTFERGPWYSFMRRQDNPYRARPGDRIYCFVRVFAPTRFKHEIALQWLLKDPESGEWRARDRIPLPIKGGRTQGYRGYAYKARWEPGDWKIKVETADGRVMGETTFRVVADPKKKPRRWKTVSM